MRLKIYLVLLFSVLARSVLAQPVAYIDNGYIQVGATASNGMFCIGSSLGAIMYGDPRSGGNSSHTIFKIDDNFYSNDPFIEPPGIPILVEEPARVSSGTIIASWVVNGITITQILQPVLVVSGGDTSGTVNIQYTFINRDTVAHFVGLLTTIDLYVGGRDDAPIAVPGYPFADTALVFAGSDVPYFFRAYSRGPEYPDSVQLVAQCNLFDPTVPMPDYIVFGDNRDILSALWYYTPPPHSRYDDAGVLIRWNPVALLPDSILTIRYSLGLAPSTVTILGALSLRFEAPSRLGFYNCNMMPNPFLVTVRVTNTTLGTAESLRATISLPEGLELANGSPTLEIRPNPNLAPGLTGYATWSIRALPPISEDLYLKYRITATSTTVDSNFGYDSIFVPFSTYRGPTAEPRIPLTNTFTSNLNQIVKLYLKDDDNRVDTSKISLKLVLGFRDTISYHYSRDTLYYEPGDSILVFRRPTGYRNGDVVVILLEKAPDLHGCQIDSMLRIKFTVDAEGPRVRGFLPEDTIITNPLVPIMINLEDDISGLRLSTLDLTLNGISYPFDNRILTYTFDTTISAYFLVLHPQEIYGPQGFPDGRYRLCLNDVTDSVQYGEPNHLFDAPLCWNFKINSHGPIANLISPSSGIITSRVDESIRFTISDGNGLDLSTLRFTINGRNYDISSLRMVNDTTFEYIPATPWTNGLVVNFELTTCQDSLRTPLSRTISCRFTVDITPPVIFNLTPSPNETVSAPFPQIRATIIDSIAGVDISELRFVIGRDTVNYGHPAISIESPSVFTFDLERFGYPRPTRFDTIRVCIIASDSINLGPPNTEVLCWSFFRNLTGPIGYPLVDTLLCENLMPLIFYLHNHDGVNFSSVVFTVSTGAETIIYRGGISPELTYANDTLIFTPRTAWLDGRRYVACIQEATDIYGTSISAPICVSFKVDINPPFIREYFPPTVDINDTLVPITIVLGDSANNILPASIKFFILNDTFQITSPGLTFRMDTLRFDPRTAGIVYPQRETLFVWIEVQDLCGHTTRWSHRWYQTKIDEIQDQMPKDLSIKGVFPNPFNTGVNIIVALPKEEEITLDIFSVTGTRIRKIHNGPAKSGYSIFTWDGKDQNDEIVPSGIYFVRLSNGKIIKYKNVILIK